MGRKLAVLAVVSLAVALVAAPAWAGGQGGLGPVNPEAPNTVRVAQAYWLIAALSVGVLLLIAIPLAVFILRYRSRGRPRRVDGAQVHGNTPFELAWTALPVLIITGIAAFVFYKLPGITDPAAAGETLRVRVEGRQFYWRYLYPNDVVAIDTLRVPAGRVVELEMTAPEHDVIHSYWIPALFGKRDTIPGALTDLRFVAKRPGTYEGQCGEFCGAQHAQMRTEAQVLEEGEFDRWLDEQASEQRRPSRQLGEVLWQGVCAKCHRLEETLVGPPLGGNTTLADRQALERIVRRGRGRMPAVGRGWSERELDSLYAYTRTLVQTGGGEGDESAQTEATGGG